jgi:signal transduction histidine kinase
MFANVGGLVGGSLLGRPDAVQQVQASRFVDVFAKERHLGGAVLWRGSVEVAELHDLVARFLGRDRATRTFTEFIGDGDLSAIGRQEAEPALINQAEQLLAGAVGAASARVMVSSIVEGEPVSVDELLTILEESSQAIRHSREMERKSAELEIAYAELRAANERLKELDRLKDEFVSTVSHELRTPLTSIRSFSEILLEEPELNSDQRSEFLGIIVKESERLTRLINQVLDLSRIDSGRVTWQMQPLDLRLLLQEVLEANRQLLRDKGAALESDLGTQPVETMGDADRLTQVIVNLLSNAAKFCPDRNGSVRVGLRQDANVILIQVTDNGPGVPPEQLRSIFDRFHQAGDEQAGRPQGTGLGLAISERIVEHHGGRIRAESEPGQGATFIVELPRKTATAVD